VTTGTISNPSETQIATPSNDDFISFVQFKIKEMGPQFSSNQRVYPLSFTLQFSNIFKIRIKIHTTRA
jgi:hypothetical protein